MSAKPLLIFDGRCGFCGIWIAYWKEITCDRVEYAPSQEVADRFPNISQEEFSRSVQLVLPDGEILSGARAVFQALAYSPGPARSLWLYDHLPGFALLTEAAYSIIAKNRTFFYHVTRLTFGRKVSRLSYASVEWLFLKLLALIYFIAFASLVIQITGLVGSNGILPVGRYLVAIREELGARGYWLAPTIFWIAHDDAVLLAGCIAGAAIAVVLFLGYFERAALVCLYLLYLSYSAIGQDFLAFQWDALLLETGFLAIFLGGSKWMIFLFRWLLFRLMFLSGVVKLSSGDPSWRNWSALSFHYMTQPLPTPIAWYAYQLPFAFQRASTAFTVVTELVAPFFVFAPRRLRHFGARWLLALQFMIFLTGNYTFFNLLTMSLCLLLFDDVALGRLRLGERAAQTKRAVVAGVAAIVLVVSGSQLYEIFLHRTFVPGDFVARLASPFEIVNTYGLFAVMTTTRPEIVVQGSNDGANWLDYEFRYKPGDLRQAPHWVAPYQPRLDWQMWFAALSGFRGAPWFGNFMVRLLEGSRPVAGLLAKNPFPGAPPKYVRALLFDYSFTDWAERRRTGNWWKREPRGIYLRAISLEDVRR